MMFEVACDRVWEGAMNPNTVIQYAPKRKSVASKIDIMDAGNAILELIKQADEIFEVTCDRAWEGAISPNTIIPYTPKGKSAASDAPKGKSAASETDMDRAGNAILEFVKHAGETTETELQEAREAAEYLADQLRAANDHIDDLEAAVRCHQARADRAEEWLRQISSEIEHGSACRLGFLRQVSG
jgi:hypothetical protein